VAAAHALGNRVFDVAVHSGFPRTIESLAIVLNNRPIPLIEMPELGDVRVGMFEGRPVGEYRRWRQNRPASDRPAGGESRLDALARYLAGAERLLELAAVDVIAVLHDVPIRFLANAALGEDPLDGDVRSVANMSITELDDAQLRVAVDVMRLRLSGAPGPVTAG
jgi:broad specificity phosphatase PhoE